MQFSVVKFSRSSSVQNQLTAKKNSFRLDTATKVEQFQNMDEGAILLLQPYAIEGDPIVAVFSSHSIIKILYHLKLVTVPSLYLSAGPVQNLKSYMRSESVAAHRCNQKCCCTAAIIMRDSHQRLKH